MVSSISESTQIRPRLQSALAEKCPGIEIRGLHVRAGQTTLFEDFCSDFAAGTVTCVLGKSGVGKSTLLNLIADIRVGGSGIFDKDNRTIVANNCSAIRASDGGSLRSRIAWMGQQQNFLPWRNVIDNACIGSRLRGQPRPEYAEELLVDVGLGEYIHARVSQLSGGMKQRLALVRTVLEERPIVLMDEPFANLDAITRMSVVRLASKMLADRTVICVTHDPMEALRFGHNIMVLSGRPVLAAEVGTSGQPMEGDFDDQSHVAAYKEIISLLG